MKRFSDKVVHILVRTIRGTQLVKWATNNLKDEMSILEDVASYFIDIPNPVLEPCFSIRTPSLLTEYDAKFSSSCYKFGILLQKENQINEMDIFANNLTENDSFCRFINALGDRIPFDSLKEDGFCGRFDSKLNSHSIFRLYRDHFKIMFHVGPLLPHSKSDSQQIERKRHIGNDIVCLIFQEKETDFKPNWISSKFLCVFIVVSLVEDSDEIDKVRYKVQIHSRKEITTFPPYIPDKPLFYHNEQFIEWILQKFICGHIASCNSPYFSKLLMETRKVELCKLIDNMTGHESQTSLRFLCCTSSSSKCYDRKSFMPKFFSRFKKK